MYGVVEADMRGADIRDNHPMSVCVCVCRVSLTSLDPSHVIVKDRVDCQYVHPATFTTLYNHHLSSQSITLPLAVMYRQARLISARPLAVQRQAIRVSTFELLSSDHVRCIHYEYRS